MMEIVCDFLFRTDEIVSACHLFLVIALLFYKRKS